VIGITTNKYLPGIWYLFSKQIPCQGVPGTSCIATFMHGPIVGLMYQNDMMLHALNCISSHSRWHRDTNYKGSH